MQYVILIDVDDQTLIAGGYQNEDSAMEQYDFLSAAYPHLTFEIATMAASSQVSSMPEEMSIHNNRAILKFADALAAVMSGEGYKKTLH
jgi:hypothetical protein